MSEFRQVTEAPFSRDAVEVVRCQRCGKLLRRRTRLSEAQQVYALAWRWVAASVAKHPDIAM